MTHVPRFELWRHVYSKSRDIVIEKTLHEDTFLLLIVALLSKYYENSSKSNGTLAWVGISTLPGDSSKRTAIRKPTYGHWPRRKENQKGFFSVC